MTTNKICTVSDCARSAVTHGMCKLHYERVRRFGAADLTKSSARGDICVVHGCGLPVKSKNYCNMHYLRLWQQTGARCSFPGCTNKLRGQGLCTGHAAQLRKGLELSPLRQFNRVQPDGTKRCPSCGLIKPMSGYHKKVGRWANECRDCTSIRNRASKFGLTSEEVRSLLLRACEVCGAEVSGKAQCIDHCHDTGKVRGVLCANCNGALGMLGEDIDRMHALIAYALRHR